MSAQPLSKYEADQFRKDPQIIARALQSYELMLDFYGLVLVSKKTGVIARNPKTYKARLMFLNNSFHNYLRMTRICKFLGIIGLEHFKKQFLRHFAIEVFKYGTVRNAAESCLKFWLPTLRNAADLKELDDMIQRITGKSYDRQKNGWHGDEQGENWATQFYACECPEYEYAANDAAQQQQMQQQEKLPPQDDILTHDCDPFEDIHKKYEAKQSQYMSRMRMGSYDDEEDEDDDNQVVLNHGRTTGSGAGGSGTATRSVLMRPSSTTTNNNNSSSAGSDTRPANNEKDDDDEKH